MNFTSGTRSDEILAQREVCNAIKFPLSVVKPLGARWLMKAFNQIQSHYELIINGFKEAGITDAIIELMKRK